MSLGDGDDTLLDTAGETTAGPTIALRSPEQQARRTERKPTRPSDRILANRKPLIPSEIESPREALMRAEIARTKLHVPIIMLLAVATLATMPLVGGWWPAKLATIIAVGIGTGCAMWLLYMTRDVRRYREGSVLVLYLLAIVSMFVGVYFWGIFSPATTVIVMELFFVGVQRHSRVALTLYLTCALFQGVLSALVIFDVVPDHGIMQGGPTMTTMEAVAGQGLVQVVYLITYLMARATRREIQRSTVDLHRAVEAVFQREVLLDEARQQLDRAIQVGGAGRLTGQPLGSFQLGAILGRGAMGEVYDAVHLDTGRPAAVKVLHPVVASSEELLTRFLREAQAAIALQSPHIVRLLEVCSATSATAYFAMEKLRGEDLGEKLRAKHRLSLPEVATLVEHIAQGLDVARAAGIVHRDIKPQNLFLASVAGREQVWKILDFGVSHLTEHGGTLTHGQLVGTPMYMAPEQAKGEQVDHRADVYGLCAVAYRALTGQPPHPVREVTAILYHVVNVAPRPPSHFVDVPADVDRIMAIGMAKDRADRFATTLELAAALRAAAR